MKKILTILTASLILSLTNTEADEGNRECKPLEYWELHSYREGFLDGFDGIRRNTYFLEHDRLAYDIGFIDGDEAFDMKHRTWKPFDFEKLIN
jgi:hypothetical protein